MKNQCHKRSGYIYKKFSTVIFSWFAVDIAETTESLFWVQFFKAPEVRKSARD